MQKTLVETNETEKHLEAMIGYASKTYASTVDEASLIERKSKAWFVAFRDLCALYSLTRELELPEERLKKLINAAAISSEYIASADVHAACSKRGE